MKKKFLCMILCVIMGISLLSGCGVSENQDTDNKSVNADIDKNSDSIKEEDTIVSNEETEMLETKPNEEPRLYDRFSEWDNAEYPTQMIQIEDMLFKKGMTMAEAVAVVEESNVNYKYDIIDEVEIGKVYSIDFSRQDGIKDGETGGVRNASFTLYYVSYKPEMDFDDCLLVGFYATGSLYQYCRFLDGISIEDLYKMTYDDIREMKEGLFSGYRRDDRYSSHAVLNYTHNFPFDGLDLESMKSYSPDVGGEPVVYYEMVLPDDSEVRVFECSRIEFKFKADTPEIDYINFHMDGMSVFDKETGSKYEN